jgi:site-specific DNA-cytosine methylase
LIIAGSPCQGFSFAGKQLAFDDPRSALFFTFIDILKHLKVCSSKIKFMLENVKMKKEYLSEISRLVGVNPICINSSLVSAQNRIRYYWTNIEGIEQPEDKGVVLADVLEDLPSCNIGLKVREKSKRLRVGVRNSPIDAKQEWDSPFQRISKTGKVKPSMEKAACLTGGANSGGNHSDMDILHSKHVTRRYSPIECERLQTVPNDYSNHVSNTQRYKMLGNGWTVDVIAHIFKQIK